MSFFKKYLLRKKIKVHPSQFHNYESFIEEQLKIKYTNTIVSEKIGYVKKIHDIVKVEYFDMDHYDHSASIIFTVSFHAICFRPKVSNTITFEPNATSDTFFCNQNDHFQIILPFSFLNTEQIETVKKTKSIDVKIKCYAINWNIKKIQIVVTI